MRGENEQMGVKTHDLCVTNSQREREREKECLNEMYDKDWVYIESNQSTQWMSLWNGAGNTQAMYFVEGGGGIPWIL